MKEFSLCHLISFANGIVAITISARVSSISVWDREIKAQQLGAAACFTKHTVDIFPEIKVEVCKIIWAITPFTEKKKIPSVYTGNLPKLTKIEPPNSTQGYYKPSWIIPVSP